MIGAVRFADKERRQAQSVRRKGEEMVSVFDIEKLKALLKDFYSISRIRITVFDEHMNELVAYPDQVAPYCAVIRESASGFYACRQCDRDASKRAAQMRTTYIYRCHAGLTEAVTPLYVGEVLVGYLFFGHAFSYDDQESGIHTIEQRCRPLRIDGRRLRETLLSACPIDESTILSASHILHAVASYLIMERMACLQEDKPAARLDAYLSAHFTEELNAASICEEMNIGKTQLYKLSGQLYGRGVAEHIRKLRMDLAKRLLTGSPHMPIAEVCERCGYHDYNYFISAFSRETGQTPGVYRKEHIAGSS